MRLLPNWIPQITKKKAQFTKLSLTFLKLEEFHSFLNIIVSYRFHNILFVNFG